MGKISKPEFYKLKAQHTDLNLKAAQFEDKYFNDMSFQSKAILNKIAKFASSTKSDKAKGGKMKGDIEDDWRLSLSIAKWAVVYQDSKFRLSRGVEGECREEQRVIVIRRNNDKREEDNTLIHEMIHVYEAMLNERLGQLMLIILFDKLSKKIGSKVWKYIYRDNHINSIVHSPLFLIKSLDLDLRTKQPLGTIYSYDRTKFFK